MPITYDETANEAIVREKPGWRQHTPCPQHRLRCYEDCSPDDAHHKAIIDHFTSMTSALRTGFPTDFTNAAVYNVVDEALANWDYLCELHPTEETRGDFGDDKPSRRKQMVAYRDVSLNRASARGTAVHSYVEARLLGLQPDWEDLAENNALTWVAAVENFLDKEQPEPVLIETVCFDRERMVAGMVDALLGMRGGTFEIDHKTRAQKEKRHFTHARRPKESAQLGGYYKMLTQGYYMDDRGRRQQVPATDLGIAVITYGEDGSYAIHEVEPPNAVEAYECSMEMREKSKLSFLMPNKAIHSEAFDPNPILKRAIDHVPDDAAEKMELSLAWKQAGFGRPSEGEVDASRFGEAMHLIYRHTARFQPFPNDNTKPQGIVAAEIVGGLADRLRALPADIAEEARRNAAGLPSFQSLTITDADVDDWDRVLSVAETAHQARQREAVNVFKMASEAGVLSLLPEDLGTWTDRDLTLATAVISAAMCNEIDLDGACSVSQSDLLDLHGGKAGVKKLAKTKASELGLDVPSKWDDLVSDPVLWAVLVAT
jgi:hypothetical protein